MPALLLPSILRRLGFMAALLAIFEVAGGGGAAVDGEASDLESLGGLQTQQLTTILMHLLVIFLYLAVLFPQLFHFSFHFTIPLLIHFLLMGYLLVNLFHLLIDFLDEVQGGCFLLGDLRHLNLALF